MKSTPTMLLSLFVVAVLAVDEEAIHLRRLRQQTLHIPDLFEMAETKKVDEWYESASNQRLMNNRKAQKLYEMDVFERLLQGDGSLSLSMPPTAPTPTMTPPVPVKAPTPPVPVKAPTPPVPVKAPAPPIPVKAPTPVMNPPVMIVPTMIPPAPVPVDSTCPYYPACAAMGLVGNCCPTPEGVFLDCCTQTPPVMAPTMVTPPVAPVFVPPVAPVPVVVSPVGTTPVAVPTKTKTGGGMSSSPGVGSPVAGPPSGDAPVAAPKSKDSGMRRNRM